MISLLRLRLPETAYTANASITPHVPHTARASANITPHVPHTASTHANITPHVPHTASANITPHVPHTASATRTLSRHDCPALELTQPHTAPSPQSLTPPYPQLSHNTPQHHLPLNPYLPHISLHSH